MIILIETEAHQSGQSECLKTDLSGAATPHALPHPPLRFGSGRACGVRREVKVRLILQTKDYTPLRRKGECELFCQRFRRVRSAGRRRCRTDRSGVL